MDGGGNKIKLQFVSAARRFLLIEFLSNRVFEMFEYLAKTLFDILFERLEAEFNSQLDASAGTRCRQRTETCGSAAAGRCAGVAGRVDRVEIVAVKDVENVALKT